MSVEINRLGDGGGQFLNGRGDGVDVFGLIEKENDKFVAAKNALRYRSPLRNRPFGSQ